MTEQTTPTVRPPAQPRLSVNMNAECAQAMREIMASEQISVTEATRRAISVYKFFLDERAAGRKLQTMRHDGSERMDVELF